MTWPKSGWAGRKGRTRISNSPRMPSYLPLPPIQRPAAIWTGARGWDSKSNSSQT